MNGRRPRGGAVADALVTYLGFLLLVCLQSPGLTAPDTKHDLVADPAGFLARATHLWNPLGFGGQVQNQAYGYLFPQGPFFALSHLVGIPPWFTERLWWALVLTVACTGLVRLAATLRIGTRGARVLGGLAYALAPRMLGDLTSISSESWVAALAPWLMLPVVAALRGHMTPRRAGAGAALVLALMGAVNAVATLLAALPAVLWFLLHRPNRTWARLAAWWLPQSLLVCVWWAVPLVLLGRVSPPFLDHIESAAVTTRWASVTEVLRGPSSWVPFVSTDRVAGAELVSEPVFVLATGVLAAAGLVGLLHGAMPARGRLLVLGAAGLLLLSAAWVGPAGGWAAEPLRAFLDGPGAPLRNVHKADPLLRIPLTLGLVHVTALLWRRLPAAGRDRAATAHARLDALAHPEREPLLALGLVLVLAGSVALAPAWQGRLAPAGSYAEVPGYWAETADWLSEHAPVAPPTAPVGSGGHDDSATTRALLVPGSSFARQLWGVTRDEPLQPLATTPWMVRDSVPLQPAPAIRALDSVQRRLADGRPAPGLSATLASLGVGFLVVRNDLAPDSGAPRPLLVHQVLESSPGLVRVATFGDTVGGEVDTRGDARVVDDSGLRPGYPAVEIYRVDSRLGADATLPGPPRSATAPYLVDSRDLPVVAGGPEALARLDDLQAARGTVDSPARTTRLLATDARAAVPDAAAAAPPDTAPGVVLGDTPVDRETDFGRVDHASSAARAEGDAPRGRGTVPDYAAGVTERYDDPGGDGSVPRTRAVWTGAHPEASSSASDSTQPGVVEPGSSPAAAVDGDPTTAWRSGGFGRARGQWLQVDLDAPADRLLLELTVPRTGDGPSVDRVEVRTDTGTATAYPKPGEKTSVPLPPGSTRTVRVTATGVSDGSRGNRFEISEFALRSGDRDLPIRRVLTLPPAPAGAAPSGWLLTQGAPGRDECVADGRGAPGPGGGDEEAAAVRCASSLAIDAEEPGVFRRVLDVPAATSVVPDLLVRPRPGPALDEVLRGTPSTRARQVRASGAAAVDDPRGGASAAVDGDRSTSWHAAAEPSPTLRLTLPSRQLVGGLRLWTPRPVEPAAPRVVTVDTGVQSTRVDLSALPRETDGSVRVPLPPDLTDHVTLRLDSVETVVDPGGTAAPGGIAEAWVEDDAGARIGALPAAGDGEVTLRCQDGPVVTIGGTRVRTSVSTTREELLRGAAVRAVPCGTAPTALAPAPGGTEVSVDPGRAFSVDTLALSTPPPSDPSPRRGGRATAAAAATPPLGSAAQRTRAVVVGDWGPAHRELAVPASPRERVLVVPESVSPAWTARLVGADGAELPAPRALTVDGWKQGWVVPASASDARLVLDVPLDGPYRHALLVGPPALLLVLLLFLLPGRDRAGARARPWRPGGVATVALTGFVLAVLGGPAGLGVTALVTTAALVVSRHHGVGAARRALVAGAAGGVVTGAALLSRAPWPSPLGYAGDGPGPQLATLSGLACAGVAAAWPGARAAVRRASARSRARRAGSSTRA